MSDDKDKKEKLGNTLDYYNDEISRKAVGKLFTNVDDFNTSKDDKKNEENPISNHYYEDARVEEEDGVIVKGFDRKRGRDDDDAPLSTRERYRRQFLDDFDQDPDRKPRGERADRYSRSDSSKGDDDTSHRRRRTPALDDDLDSPKGEGRRELLKSEGYSRRSETSYDDDDGEAKYTKIERAPRSTYKKYDRDKIQQNAQSPSQPMAREKRGDGSEMAILNTPLFKIMCGVILVLILVTFFLVFQVNSANKKVKAFEADKSKVEEKLKEAQAVMDAKDADDVLIKELKTEIGNLKIQIIDMERPPEPVEGGTPTPETPSTETPVTGTAGEHVVVPGDSLSAISRKYYGNISGVDKIKAANGLTNDNITVGKKLIIPQ